MGKNGKIRRIRNIITRNRETLEMVLPKGELQCLLTTYNGSHQPPSKYQINSDERYLKRILDLG